MFDFRLFGGSIKSNEKNTIFTVLDMMPASATAVDNAPVKPIAVEPASASTSTSATLPPYVAAPETSPSEPKFTTQDDIMSRAGAAEDAPGICSPMTNSYTKYQMGELQNKQGIIDGTPDEIYAAARAQNDKQLKTYREGKDGNVEAFANSGKNYETKKVPTLFLGSSTYAKHILNNKEQVMIKLPVKGGGPKASHLIGIGKYRGNFNKCYSFDANRPGGETIDDCDKVFAQMSSDILAQGYVDKLSMAEIYSIPKP